jgi:hypothetical protein
MKKIFMVTLLIFPLFSYAQKAQLTVIDPDIDDTELRENFNVHRGSTHKSSIPDKTSREELLKDLKGISDWDELKKDIFYMDLKSKSLDELSKKYPELSPKQLTDLKKRR